MKDANPAIRLASAGYYVALYHSLKPVEVLPILQYSLDHFQELLGIYQNAGIEEHELMYQIAFAYSYVEFYNKDFAYRP